MSVFDPDNWLTSMMRSLKAYMEVNLADNFDLEMAYPDVTAMVKNVPLPKTLIHFDVENPDAQFFGLGDNIVADEITAGDTLVEHEATCYVVTLDLGVWAFVETGGPTSRMEAMEQLTTMFSGPQARAACMTATNGVEVLDNGMSGGRFLTDSIDDIPVFRVTDMSLRIRVYARKKLGAIEYIHQIPDQDPQLVIDGSVTIDA
jgi:hypothetical protein